MVNRNKIVLYKSAVSDSEKPQKLVLIFFNADKLKSPLKKRTSQPSWKLKCLQPQSVCRVILRAQALKLTDVVTDLSPHLVGTGNNWATVSLALIRSPYLASWNPRLSVCAASQRRRSPFSRSSASLSLEVARDTSTFQASFWIPCGFPRLILLWLHVHLSYLTLVLMTSGTTQHRKAIGLHRLPNQLPQLCKIQSD